MRKKYYSVSLADILAVNLDFRIRNVFMQSKLLDRENNN